MVLDVVAVPVVVVEPLVVALGVEVVGVTGVVVATGGAGVVWLEPDPVEPLDGFGWCECDPPSGSTYC